MTRMVYRGTAQVPVVPGPAGPTLTRKDCDACGATGVPVELLRVDGADIKICVALYRPACTLRYRMGMSPRAYQLYLRGQEAVSMPVR